MARPLAPVVTTAPSGRAAFGLIETGKNPPVVTETSPAVCTICQAVFAATAEPAAANADAINARTTINLRTCEHSELRGFSRRGAIFARTGKTNCEEFELIGSALLERHAIDGVSANAALKDLANAGNVTVLGRLSLFEFATSARCRQFNYQERRIV
jgi:hypothetical protein